MCLLTFSRLRMGITPIRGRAWGDVEEGSVGEWRKATVVEVEPSGLTWRKSTASTQDNNNCLETAPRSASVLVRNSRDRQRAPLSVPNVAWTALLSEARAGVLDLTR